MSSLLVRLRIGVRPMIAGLIAIMGCGSLAASASGERSLVTGFAESRYQAADPDVRAQAMSDTVKAGADVTLLFVSWRDVTSRQPLVASDPGDPAYNFSILDAAVADAASHDLDPLLTVSRAPSFAEGADPPAAATPGTWRPSASAFGDFGAALATRYSGSYVSPGDTKPLPRVRLFQAWTEPNLSNHLSPQYEKGQPVAPDVFRSLLNSFYASVKSVHSDNKVVTGATAPYGDPPGGERTRPLRFWRDVFCLKDRRKLKPTSCQSKPAFDVLAHNPINTSGGPNRSALHPDDVSTPDLDNLRRILRAAERRNHVAPGGRRPLWATELWWETDPPDSKEGIPPRKQARYLEEALHILWSDGAELVINLQLQDLPVSSGSETASGVLFENGDEKPSFTAFRFPFVTERPGKRIEAWGRAPVGGRLVIERKSGSGWRSVRKLNVKEGEIFEAQLRLQGKQQLRARVGSEKSLPWKQR